MKVCFVCSENESLGVEYLSAVLRENSIETELLLDPRLFDDSVIRLEPLSRLFSFREPILDRIAALQPDLVAFQVFTDNLRWALDLSREIKKRTDIPIVFGGVHPSAAPQPTIEQEPVDHLVLGEGELPLLELTRRIGAGESTANIANVWSKVDGVVHRNDVRPLIEELDTLPFPDKELFRRIGWDLSSYTIITGRGCPFNCTFCSNSFYRKLYRGKGTFLRRRSVSNVIEELSAAKERYRVKRVVFDDEIFTHHPKWLREFSAAYRRQIGLPSFCWVHPSTMTRDVVDSLAAMGTAAVEMGVQSIDPSIRKDLYDRRYDNERLQQALSLLRDAGIDCIADNIVGPEDDVEKTIEELIRFYARNPVTKAYLFNLKAFPGTEIADRLRQKRPGRFARQALDDERSFLMERNLGEDARRMVLLLPLLPFLDPKAVEAILDRRAYRFFPPLSHNLLMEIGYVLRTLARGRPLFTRMTARKYLRFGRSRILSRQT